jgi:hypothetical protein
MQGHRFVHWSVTFASSLTEGISSHGLGITTEAEGENGQMGSGLVTPSRTVMVSLEASTMSQNLK